MMLNNQCSAPQTRDPFQNLLGRLFGDSIGETNSGSASTRRHSPLTNISETNKTYVLSFELPGVAETDIQVQLHDKTLTVTAVRKDIRDVTASNVTASNVTASNAGDQVATSDAAASQNSTDNSVRWHRLEHRYGQYSRAISLPANAAIDGVEAVYQLGVLTVTVPKRKEAQPAKITVRTA